MALMSKAEGTVPLQAKRHQVFLVIKRETTAQKPVHTATPLPAHWPPGQGSPPGVPMSTQSHPETITYSNEGCSQGLITDVAVPSISFLNHSFKWAGTRKEAILPLAQWASFITLAVLHYSPIIFYFDGIIREVLIWLFHNSENEYQCNIKLLL